MIQSCCCAANTDFFRESTIGYPDVDEPPTCEPSRQTSSLVCLFPSSALTAVHIQAVPVSSRSHHLIGRLPMMSFVVCTSFFPSGVFTMYGFLSNGFTVRFRTSIPFNKGIARLSAPFGYMRHSPPLFCAPVTEL